MNFYINIHPVILTFGSLIAYVMPQTLPLITNLTIAYLVVFSSVILLDKRILCLRPWRKSFFISRDVIFYEQTFLFDNLPLEKEDDKNLILPFLDDQVPLPDPDKTHSQWPNTTSNSSTNITQSHTIPTSNPTPTPLQVYHRHPSRITTNFLLAPLPWHLY